LHQAGLVEIVAKSQQPETKKPGAATSRRRKARGAQPDKKVLNKLIDKLKSM
jgi:hypothetical protein